MQEILTNQKLLDLVRERDHLLTFDPNKLYPILFRPCRVRVLLVADGGLDFSIGGFGLRAFVESLLDMPGYHVKFDITLAHIHARSGGQMMDPDTRITRRISQFKFDNPEHFGPDKYDQVWLFGIDTIYRQRNGYPTDRLGDKELAAITQFMNGGGGLFATGDHGSLGACLGGSVPRARSMRLWGPAGDAVGSEVSMTHSRRNDTNRQGSSPGSQFNDQSDDVPQPIEPKMYHRRMGIFRFSYPHPLLCSPGGVIRVMPDHPHEGECVAPANPNQQINYVNPPVPEYPPAAGGGTRPLPEIISTSSVPAGNTASATKDPTVAQTFGGICAYDGHLAKVGRVVTDPTWHHFVNINLIGDQGAPFGDPKRLGYLASPAGMAHLEQIKTYFRNIAVWLSRPSQIVCMQRRLKWGVIWTDRVMEAVMTKADIPLAKLDTRNLLDIGRHARDVLGQYVGACQARRIILYEIERVFPKPWLDLVDPWLPLPPRGPEPGPDPVPWLDPELVLDIALGGALAALREEFPDPDPQRLEEIEKSMDKVSARGVEVAVGFALESFGTTVNRYTKLFESFKGGRTNSEAE
ncbi:hypothetical protein [Telluribacter humicola]|uniref:hypothetical protein n=1 Tax=Telluribacter humicola TaxID=1720261 RepID=UPI001A95A5CD|nr:hypothetical protein [Telluribacter humicola]